MRLYMQINKIYNLIIDEEKDRKTDATRAIFILTDAEATSKTDNRIIPWDSLKSK